MHQNYAHAHSMLATKTRGNDHTIVFIQGDLIVQSQKHAERKIIEMISMEM